MRSGFLAAFAALLLTLTVTACVVEPYGEDRDHYHGGHDYGHRVWHE